MSDRKLACPSCGFADQLSTIETIQGAAGAVFYADGEISHDGETDVFWDSSETIGIMCRNCGWEAFDFKDSNVKAESLLVPEKILCLHCGEHVDERDGKWVHVATGAERCDPDDDYVATPNLED